MEASRLRWACRRGMLELDILLERYLDKRYEHASSEEQVLFQALLACQDQELFEWLVNAEVPANEQYAKMVAIIRSHNMSYCDR